MSTLERRTGFDLNTFIAHADGHFAISSDTTTTIARVDVSDPPALAAMITKLATVPASRSHSPRAPGCTRPVAASSTFGGPVRI